MTEETVVSQTEFYESLSRSTAAHHAQMQSATLNVYLGALTKIATQRLAEGGSAEILGEIAQHVRDMNQIMAESLNVMNSLKSNGE